MLIMKLEGTSRKKTLLNAFSFQVVFQPNKNMPFLQQVSKCFHADIYESIV